MNAKYTLALFALIGIGVFALPSTMALFSGQHSFYNIDATGNQVPCTKCHGDVKAELSSGGSSITGTAGPHANFQCEYCHRIEAGAASGDNAYGRLTYKDNQSGTTASRILIVPLTDMESGNVPATITIGDNVTTAEARTAVNGAPSSSPTKGSFLLSTCLQTKNMLTACDDTTKVLTVAKPDMREIATYWPTNGTTKDTNPATNMTALDISKMNFIYTSVSISASATATDNLTNAGSKAVNPGSTYHAASLVSCMECHGGDEPMGHNSRVADGTDNNGTVRCSNCHYGYVSGPNFAKTLWAGGFNLTGQSADTGAVEAHNNWVKTNDSISRFGGANGNANNDACVACHTHVAVQISFKKGYLLQFNATESPTGNYTVDNSSVQGTVSVTTYGNSSGNAFAVSNSTYDWAPVNGTLYINGTATGIQVVGLGTNGTSTNDSAAALSNGQ
jgi:hypothetical protein